MKAMKRFKMSLVARERNQEEAKAERLAREAHYQAKKELFFADLQLAIWREQAEKGFKS